MQPDDQMRIVNALDALINDSTGLDIKPLKGRTELRLRVGKYRVLFTEDRENQLYIALTGQTIPLSQMWEDIDAR